MKTPIAYVNVNGELLGYDLAAGRKKAAPRRSAPAEPKSYHNGWRVVGIPPGALEAAEQDHPRLIAAAKAHNEMVARDKGAGKAIPVPGPWDAEKWMNEVKKSPVRAKAYEIPESAQLCKELAEKAGWLRVEVIELKLDLRGNTAGAA